METTTGYSISFVLAFLVILTVLYGVHGSLLPNCQTNGQDCRCPKGYVYRSNVCDDIDECISLNGRCQQSCVNTVGSYKCECQIGYKLANDNHRCDDFDECSVNRGDCDPTQRCVNIWGGSFCVGPNRTSKEDPNAPIHSKLLNNDVMIGVTVWLGVLTVLSVGLTTIAFRSPYEEDSLYPKGSTNPEYYSPHFWPRLSITDNSRRRDLDIHY